MMKVLVTGATRNVGMAAIRALAKEGCEVIGADERRLPFGVYSRYIKSYYLHPEVHEDGYLSAIFKIIEIEKPDVLLPFCGMRQIIKERRKIERLTNILMPDEKSFLIAYDNQTTLEECQKIGIACPKIFTEEEAIQELKKDSHGKGAAKFILKPRADIGGAYGVSMIGDEGTLQKLKRETEKFYGKTVIEEYIPGNTEAMRTVTLLFNKTSKLAAYFTTKKLRAWPTTGGIGVLLVSTNEWDLVEMVLPFFEKWQWQGAAEVEIKIDVRDGKPKLIEINPRFGGYLGFPCQCGLNLPWIACELAQGITTSNGVYPSYSEGVEYIHPYPYLKSALSEMVSSNNRSKVIKNIYHELKGEKVSNNFECREWKVIFAKMLFELQSKVVRDSPHIGLSGIVF